MPRYARRLARPTGLTVVLAGPDGAGKSTLGRALADAPSIPFRGVRSLHLSPGLLPPLARLAGRRVVASAEQPHDDRASGAIVSVIRICWLAADTALGWWPKIQRLKVRSTLVVIERGWHDLEVDPRRHRLSVGSGLVRLLGRILPSRI